MASCVATAYIIRYGRVKADGGPAGGAVFVEASPSAGLGDGADMPGEGEGALVMRGGSIDECDVGGFDGMTGSGKDGISSSIFEVSIVICLVGGAA
jgi:hypothetical protein